MDEGTIGEIRLFAGNFAPRNWAFCDGTKQQIERNPSLYAVLGTTYGGDGRTDFALPNIKKDAANLQAGLNYIICVNGLFPARN